MKNKKNLFNIFFIALLLFSCEKEKQIVKGNLPTAGNHSANGQRIHEEDMEDAMNTFITMTNENNFSECPDYEAQDALLIIEAALNYHTCMPDSDYDEIAADTVNFSMYLTKDQNAEFIFTVKNDSMVSLWSRILAAAEGAYERVAFDSVNNPFNIVVDLEFTNFNPEYDGNTQTVTLQMITWVGNTPSTTWNCTFSQSLDAIPTYHTCGPTTNWSTKAIQRKLGPLCRGASACDYFAYITNPPVEFTYLTNQTPCTGGPSPCFQFGTQPTSYLWYYVDPGNQPLPYYCMSTTEMACSAAGMLHLGPCYAPDDPSSTDGGVKLKVISYNFDVFFNPLLLYSHWCRVKYGKCMTGGGQ